MQPLEYNPHELLRDHQCGSALVDPLGGQADVKMESHPSRFSILFSRELTHLWNHVRAVRGVFNTPWRIRLVLVFFYANMTGVKNDGIHGPPYIAAPWILWVLGHGIGGIENYCLRPKTTLASWDVEETGSVSQQRSGFPTVMKWVCLKMSCTPKPNGFADHYPVFKWLFHWGYTLF